MLSWFFALGMVLVAVGCGGEAPLPYAPRGDDESPQDVPTDDGPGPDDDGVAADGSVPAMASDDGPDAGGDTPSPDSDRLDMGRRVLAVGAGGSNNNFERFRCALLSDGTVRCWGSSTYGALGLPGELHVAAPRFRVDVGGYVTKLSVGTLRVCVLLDTGAVRCWGAGEACGLGYGELEHVGDDETPASKGDIDLGGKAVDIAAGSTNTCALMEDGGVRCWGCGGVGALGYGNDETIGDDEAPATAGDVSLGGRATSIAVGHGSSCAVLETGGVRCWGGAAAVAGVNPGLHKPPSDYPEVDVGEAVEQVSMGGSCACAVTSSGGVRCWGRSEFGQLGYPGVQSLVAPSEQRGVDVGGRVRQVSVGYRTACALLESGEIRCWGTNYQPNYSPPGLLGTVESGLLVIGDDETPADYGKAVDIGGDAIQISIGDSTSCALRDARRVYCWGSVPNPDTRYYEETAVGDDESPAGFGPVRFSDPDSNVPAGG